MVLVGAQKEAATGCCCCCCCCCCWYYWSRFWPLRSRLLAGISSTPYQDNLHLARQLRWAARVLMPRDNAEVREPSILILIPPFPQPWPWSNRKKPTWGTCGCLASVAWCVILSFGTGDRWFFRTVRPHRTVRVSAVETRCGRRQSVIWEPVQRFLLIGCLTIQICGYPSPSAAGARPDAGICGSF